MNIKRTATIVVVGAALAAWLSAAMTPGGRGPASFARVDSASVETRGAELASEVARLHERLRPDAIPRQPGRNLFSFRATAHPAAPPALARPAPVEPSPRPIVSQPALKLAGIAEDVGADGPVRTAIISGSGQLFLVKEGEQVTSRYVVTKISADVVELKDLGDDSIRRLALK